MQQAIQQTYRHLVQQHIVRQQLTQQEAPRTAGRDADAEKRAHARGMAWEMGGVLALFAAATAAGILAQAHLG